MDLVRVGKHGPALDPQPVHGRLEIPPQLLVGQGLDDDLRADARRLAAGQRNCCVAHLRACQHYAGGSVAAPNAARQGARSEV